MCKELSDIIVCTDSNIIKNLVKKHNGKSLLTKKNHKTGTDRIAEISKQISYDIAIDIQGDFPL